MATIKNRIRDPESWVRYTEVESYLQGTAPVSPHMKKYISTLEQEGLSSEEIEKRLEEDSGRSSFGGTISDNL